MYQGSFRPLLLLLVFASLILSSESNIKVPQWETKWFQNNPNTLPKFLTTAEKELLKSGKYTAEIPKNAILAPPPGPVRNIAEFERMSGVLIAYTNTFGITTELIKEMAKDVIVYVITGSESSAKSKLSNAGVNMSNVKFINHGVDAYWTRDCGPWWISDGNGKISIVDFKYDRPRPKDNQVPSKVAPFLGVDLYYMPLSQTGGNYMTDGHGISISTDLVTDENNSSAIDRDMKAYLGIHTYYITMDPPNDYIKHVDCWGKYLSPSKIIVLRTRDQNSARYDEVADLLASKKSSYGKNYKIYRIDSNKEPYSNSTILNDKVLVPIKGSSNDQKALDVYRKAMPGYKIMGFTGSWLPTDALHCRTKGIPDLKMLYMKHIPLQDTLTSTNGSGYPLEVEITAYSGQPLKTDSLLIYYKPENSSKYLTTKLTKGNNNTYTGKIPAQKQSGTMSYYISASDESGRKEFHPFIGEPDAHTFYAKSDGTGVSTIENMSRRNFYLSAHNLKSGNIQISYLLNHKAKGATLIIRNSKGQILTKESLTKQSGTYIWNKSLSNKVSSGLYFCSIYNSNHNHTIKFYKK